jgi:mono/diheme cytochrome c family protein
MRDRFTIAVTLLLTVLTGCRATPPGKLETTTITFAKHHFFIGNKRDKNPLPDAPATLADGKDAFSHYCVACHGVM